MMVHLQKSNTDVAPPPHVCLVPMFSKILRPCLQCTTHTHTQESTQNPFRNNLLKSLPIKTYSNSTLDNYGGWLPKTVQILATGPPPSSSSRISNLQKWRHCNPQPSAEFTFAARDIRGNIAVLNLCSTVQFSGSELMIIRSKVYLVKKSLKNAFE